MPQSRFPIAYWGSISYYQHLLCAENPLVELYETYPKQTFRNRCVILTAGGVHELSIPVKRVNGSKTLTKDIVVSYEQDWQKIHWRAIKSAYASSPYFDHYDMEIEKLIFEKHHLLTDFFFEIHQRICDWLALPLKIESSTDFFTDYPNDYLQHFEQRKASADYFYQQVFTTRETFVPDLSILDAVMNLGPMARTLLPAAGRFHQLINKSTCPSQTPYVHRILHNPTDW